MAKKSASSSSPTLSKAEAIRRTVAEGITSGTAGSAHILKTFGLEVTKGHFSASVSHMRSKEAGQQQEEATAPAATVQPKPAKAVASSASASASETDIIAAMEAMKPLITALGVDKVKRLADLLS